MWEGSEWAGWPAGRPLSGKQEVQRGAAAICGPHTFPQQTAAVRDAAWAVMQPANCHRLLIYSAWFAVRKKKRICFGHLNLKVELEPSGLSTGIDSRIPRCHCKKGVAALIVQPVDCLAVGFLCCFLCWTEETSGTGVCFSDRQTTQDRILYPLSALPVNATSHRPQLPLEEPRFSIPPTRKRCFLHSHSRSEASAHGETAQIFMRADERCRISSGSALSFGDASRLTEFKRSVGGLKVAPL